MRRFTGQVKKMLHFSPAQIYATSYREFIPFLKDFYTREVTVPARQHYHLDPGRNRGILLLMPSWQTGAYAGVKIISVFPENANRQLPSIQGTYLLMNAENGELLASFDGPALTTIRTAAVSGLAADLVCKFSVRSMLMIGTGQLCLELIRAHSSVHPITTAYIWGRNYDKAQSKANTFIPGSVALTAVKDKNTIMSEVDLISSATYSDEPLIHGDLLPTVVHIDLVGSYQPHMREADDRALAGASIYVDDYHALVESGDLAIPLKKGTLSKNDVLADLKELALMDTIRKNESGRTLFKSVGNARSDLALAVFLYTNKKK